MNNSSNTTVIRETESNEFVKLVATADNNALVRFHDLQPLYQPGEDIYVSYELSTAYTPSHRDRIGLYSTSSREPSEYLWTASPPKEEKARRTRGVLIPAGEVEIEPSATNKYIFLYISKAREVLAQSPAFRVCDLESLEILFPDVSAEAEDLGEFAVIHACAHAVSSDGVESPDTESAEEEEEEPVKLTCSPGHHNGRTLAQIFGENDRENQAPGAPPQEQHQIQQVGQLFAQVAKLREQNVDLRENNQRMMKNLSSMNIERHSAESKLQNCTARLNELRTVVRLQKKGNQNLEKECARINRQAKGSAQELKRVQTKMKALQEEKSQLEQKLSKQEEKSEQPEPQLDYNGNIVAGDDDDNWVTVKKKDRKAKKIARLVRNLEEDKAKCERLEAKLETCEARIRALQAECDSLLNAQAQQQKKKADNLQNNNKTLPLSGLLSSAQAEVEKLKRENFRLQQEVGVVRRQRMRMRHHLVEKEAQMKARLASLQNALRLSRRTNKKLKEKYDAQKTAQPEEPKSAVKRKAEEYEEEEVSVSRAKTPFTSRVEEEIQLASSPEQTSLTSRSWEEYLRRFKTSCQEAWNRNFRSRDKVSPPASCSGIRHYASLLYPDPLAPFSVFPVVGTDDLGTPNMNEAPEGVAMDMDAVTAPSDWTAAPRLLCDIGAKRNYGAISDKVKNEGDLQARQEVIRQEQRAAGLETSDEWDVFGLVALFSEAEEPKPQKMEKQLKVCPLPNDEEELGLEALFREQEPLRPSFRKDKACSARKTVTFLQRRTGLLSQQEDAEETALRRCPATHGPRKGGRKFMCYPRRVRYPGRAAQWNRAPAGTRATGSRAPVSPLTK